MKHQEIKNLLNAAFSEFDDKSDADNIVTVNNIVSRVLETGDFNIWMAPEYSEPGCYNSSESFPVFFANWNKEGHWSHRARFDKVLKLSTKFVETCDIMARLGTLLEDNGAHVEWSDEWCQCEQCGNAFRTSPDSYSWTQYGISQDFALCGNCILEDPSDYFDWLTSGDNSNRAITIRGINPEDHGYVKINTEPFENGLHGGQDASPDAISDTLRGAGVDRFLFLINSSGQFDIKFSVYAPEDDAPAAIEALASGNTRCEVDPKRALEEGLKAASKAMAEATGEGVPVGTVDLGTGTGTARRVPPEEFIRGE